MATEILKLRRKKTIKRNSVIQVTLIEVDELLTSKARSADDQRIELTCRLESLLESNSIVKDLDAKIFDLIEDDEEAEKDRKRGVSS